MSGFVPTPTPETAPFWSGAEMGELRTQQCTLCGKHYFYPRSSCPYCGSIEVRWTTVSGRATLVSYVINQRPLPPFPPDEPLIVAIVRLEEGPQMMTNIVDVPPDPRHLPLDLPLNVHFVRRESVFLPVFAPAQVAA